MNCKKVHCLMNLGIVVTGLCLSALQSLGQSAGNRAPQEKGLVCSIAILDPLQGAAVGGGSTVSGTATLPTNSHLWILAHKKPINAWWPQGGGETPVDAGKWAVDVTFGIATDKGDFEIVAVAVDDNVNNSLNNWVATAPSNNYAPIRFPTVTEGCSTAKVIVDKR